MVNQYKKLDLHGKYECQMSGIDNDNDNDN